MIKRDLIEQIYLKHGGMSRKEVQQNVDLLLQEIRRGVVKHGSLVISGFGTFKIQNRPSREIILPNGQTKQTTTTPRISFFPSRKLKAALNEESSSQE